MEDPSEMAHPPSKISFQTGDVLGEKENKNIKKNCALGSGASFSTVLFHELFKYKLSINEIRVFSSAVFNFVTGSHDVALVTKGKTTKPATLDLRSTCTAMAQ